MLQIIKMPRKKKSLEEKRESKKLAERRRMAKIKADPELIGNGFLNPEKATREKNKEEK